MTRGLQDFREKLREERTQLRDPGFMKSEEKKHRSQCGSRKTPGFFCGTSQGSPQIYAKEWGVKYDFLCHSQYIRSSYAIDYFQVQISPTMYLSSLDFSAWILLTQSCQSLDKDEAKCRIFPSHTVRVLQIDFRTPAVDTANILYISMICVTMLQPCPSVAGFCLSKVSFCWWRVPNLKRFKRGGKYHPLGTWQASWRGTEKRGRSLGREEGEIRGWHWDVGLRVPGCKSRFSVFIKWFDIGTACHVQAFSNDLILAS